MTSQKKSAKPIDAKAAMQMLAKQGFVIGQPQAQDNDAETRSLGLRVRFSPSEVEQIKLLAEADGRTISGWMRRQILAKISGT